ncbi:hypothetical protein Gpo141_00000374 [Globisporangium polare]
MEYRVRRRNATERMPGFDVEMIITDALIRRFLLRAGFRTSSQTAVAHTRQHLCDFLRKLVHTMFPLAEHGHRMSFCLADVVSACRFHGIRLYGYDDVCNLESTSGSIETLHVTEMVETRTTFGGPDTWDDEPDMEPGARFKKTDFVANYHAFNEGEEEESDGDDSEWSWYGESDADSDSEDEDVKMDSDNNSSIESKPWQRPHHGNRFIDSLKAAQALVDEQLLQTNPTDDEMDDDAAPGQGYFSDYDEVHEPATSVMQEEAVRKEDELWSSNNNLHEIDDDKAEQVLDTIFFNDEADQYTIPRQVFTRFFRSTLGLTLKISTVALSALHNVTEQYLHRELAQGVLFYQLQAIISKEKAAQENDLQEQLRQEREKVNEREQKIADLKAAFKAKEIEMQHQIAQLQHQLRVQQHSSEDFHMQTPNRTPRKRKSPGKRKLTPNSKRIEIVRKEAVKSSTSPKPVGSLRSKIQDYALRSKKTRVNVV